MGNPFAPLRGSGRPSAAPAPYRPGDFSIGTHVEVFKRDFHIVDADPKTRRYFEETIGQPLGPAEADTPVCRPATDSEPPGRF